MLKIFPGLVRRVAMARLHGGMIGRVDGLKFTPPSVYNRLFSTKASDSAKETKENTSTSAEEAKKDNPAGIKASKEELVEKMGRLQDAYLNSLADLENARRKLAEEKERSNSYAVQKFSNDLLFIADILDMAIESVPEKFLAEDADASQEPLRALHKGVRLTQAEFLKALEKHGVKPFDPLHQAFDPNLHSATFQVPTKDHPAGTVVQVQKKGFTLHDRLLRPAHVAVSRSPDTEDPQDSKKKQ